MMRSLRRWRMTRASSLFGEDVPLLRRNLLARFGPSRVRNAPISESAFLGAACRGGDGRSAPGG